MLLDFDDIDRIGVMADKRQGFLEYDCNMLGLCHGVNATLEGPMKADIMAQAIHDFKTKKHDVLSRVLNVFDGQLTSVLRNGYYSERAELHWLNVKNLLSQSRYRRSLAHLTDREITVLRALVAHTNALKPDEQHHEELIRFFIQVNSKLVWAGGQGQFVQSPCTAEFPYAAKIVAQIIRPLMQLAIDDDVSSYEQELAHILGQFVQLTEARQLPDHLRSSAMAISKVINPELSGWLTPQQIEAGQSPYKHFEPGLDLFLGRIPVDGDQFYRVGYNGTESLVTVAQPGAGKTQCHILHNLMCLEESVVVLDPKLELVEKSAGFRQFNGHRILVLNLAEDDHFTHQFNVLAFMDTRLEFLWGAVIEIAEFLIPEAKGDSNPIFRSKAAEIFAVCLGGIVLEAREIGDVPNISQAIRKVFLPVDRLKDFFLNTQDRAERFGCVSLMESAQALAALLANVDTIEDFQRFQTNATSALMKFRGGVIDRVANGAGDWCPEDLRTPGTTLYIRLPFEEMAVYGGYVRLVLYTLIKKLRRSDPDLHQNRVTFLLDEVAQLGNLDQIINVIETGRSFGLRAWMILQDYDQARQATSKPNLILNTPKLRVFMNPSLEAARNMSAELGNVTNIVTGRDKPMVEPAALMGESFKDDIVILSSGARPLRLKKFFSYQEERYEEFTSLPCRFESFNRTTSSPQEDVLD